MYLRSADRRRSKLFRNSAVALAGVLQITVGSRTLWNPVKNPRGREINPGGVPAGVLSFRGTTSQRRIAMPLAAGRCARI
jgi:hypothetical protein